MVTLNHGKCGSSARITLAILQSIIPEQLLFVRSTTLADKGCVGWNGMGWKDGTEIDVCSRIVKKQVYSYIPDHRTICGESQPLRIPPRPCDAIILRARGVPSDQYPSYYGNTVPLTHSLAHMQAQEQESCSCTPYFAAAAVATAHMAGGFSSSGWLAPTARPPSGSPP
jgi:hypothetical protein